MEAGTGKWGMRQLSWLVCLVYLPTLVNSPVLTRIDALVLVQRADKSNGNCDLFRRINTKMSKFLLRNTKNLGKLAKWENIA
jgi:hypothetical protein